MLHLPDLGFPEAWLAGAELSVSQGRPDRIGVSVFLPTLPELERLAARFPECRGLAAEERALRGALPLADRYWVKLTFDGSRLTDVSQYFQLDDSVGYPITSLRWFGRRYGAEGVDRLEGALRPELERAGTVWGLVLRHGDGDPCPHFAVRVPRDAAAPLLARLVQAGFVASEAAEALTCVGLDSPHPRYVAWTPGDPRACAMDFQDVAPDSIPPLAELPPGVRWRYAKARPGPRGLSWSGYVGWSELQPRIGDLSPADYVRAVQGYYDDTVEQISDAFGSTYQAGWLVPTAAAGSNVCIAERAGLRAGERVLDAGSGLGGPAADVRAAVPGVRVTGITVSTAQARASGEVAGDFHDLPFGDGSFDVVLFLESAGYAHDLTAVFREAHRVLVPGGRLYVKDVVRVPADDGSAELHEFERTFRFRTRTRDEMARAAEAAGFRVTGTADLGDQVTMHHWSRAMFRSDGTLSPFGERHYRMLGRLPLGWAELTAVRGGHTGPTHLAVDGSRVSRRTRTASPTISSTSVGPP